MDDFRTPGQLIEHLLNEKGWTKRVLAVVIGIDESAISRIVNGKKPVDAPLALQLGGVFGVPAERFVELQAHYDLARAQLAATPDPGLAVRARVFGDLPVADMIKRGWLRARDVRDVKAVEKELQRFFGTGSLDEIAPLAQAFKKTDATGATNDAQIAWLYRVNQVVSEMVVPKYSSSALRSVVTKMRGLLSSPDLVRHVPKMLIDAGVRFAIVETIGDAKVDGVCAWARTGAAPAIAMSCRFDRIDNFWFVLRHELEHVLREDGKDNDPMLDAELDGGTGADVPERERRANEAAADFCVPVDQLKRFIALKSPLFPERDLLGFARTLRVHPGLVVGQLRHKTGRCELFAKHLVKVRHVVAPNAMVDGWGNVAPVRQ